MNINGIWLRLISMAMLFITNGCTDFLNVNQDPNNPSSPEASKLLTGGQVNFVAALAESYEPGAASYVQHILHGGWSSSFPDATIILAWDQLYSGSLIDLHNLINQQERLRSYHYSGISKILTAYIYSVLVDLFGTIPFSEALHGDDSNIFNPNYEEGENIYTQLFEMIDSGLNDLSGESQLTPDEDDLIYSGDINAWIKAGHSLKLKLYNQIRLVDPDLAKSEINNLIAGENLISNIDEGFTFHFGFSASPDNRHPLFEPNYNFKFPQMGDFLGRTLMGAKSDPRMPYYFYNQSNTFISSSDGSVNSVYGIYPVGGLFDDGQAMHVDPEAANGAGFFPIITYSMVLFVQAEASLTLGTTGEPKLLLEQAIRASMEGVEYFSNIPMPVGAKESYINNLLDEFDNSLTVEEKLEIIMTEKYVSLFGNGIEAYNDVRRTGYPKFQSNFFPPRWKLPETEVRFNNNTPDDHDFTEPVFWDIN